MGLHRDLKIRSFTESFGGHELGLFRRNAPGSGFHQRPADPKLNAADRRALQPRHL